MLSISIVKKESSHLAIESIMVGIKGKVVEIEEAEPVTASDGRVAADGFILVTNPHQHNNVECRRGVIEELRHDGFHTCKMICNVFLASIIVIESCALFPEHLPCYKNLLLPNRNLRFKFHTPKERLDKDKPDCHEYYSKFDVHKPSHHRNY